MSVFLTRKYSSWSLQQVTAKTKAVTGVHGPLVCAVQDLPSALLQVHLVLILRCSVVSDAAKLLTVWLPGEIALPSCLLTPMSISLHRAASRECCLWQVWLSARAWFWLSGSAKITRYNNWFRKKPKGRKKSLVQEGAFKVKDRCKMAGRMSMVQASVWQRVAAARCHELRSQGVGKEWEGAWKDLWVVWGILM